MQSITFDTSDGSSLPVEPSEKRGSRHLVYYRQAPIDNWPDWQPAAAAIAVMLVVVAMLRRQQQRIAND